MWYRNLTLFRFSENVAKSLDSLNEDAAEKCLRPCGPIELGTRGFVTPYGLFEDVFAFRLADVRLVTFGAEDKIIPSAVINNELAKRLQKISDETGKRVGARERKRIKEEVLTDLLPKAFIRSTRRNGYLDPKNGWLVVDTASKKAAEESVTMLREALGSFPAVPMAPEESPRALMTDWLAHGRLPEGFVLGDECELRDPVESGAITRCRRQELETDEVREHLKSGKQVCQLGLVFEDRVSFNLGEDLVIRKLRFLDIVQDELGDNERENAAAEIESVMTLQTMEISRLLARLSTIFGLDRPKERS